MATIIWFRLLALANNFASFFLWFCSYNINYLAKNLNLNILVVVENVATWVQFLPIDLEHEIFVEIWRHLAEKIMSWPRLQGHQNVHNYAMVKDRLFVLHKEKQKQRKKCVITISEFQGHKCEPHWTKVKDHQCGIWGRSSRAHDWLAMLACEGSLLVYAGKQEHWPDKPHLDARLYDLEKCEWRVLPELPDERTWQKQEWMCELQWDIAP